MAGIEAEFVEKPPKAFQYECPICLLVLREPYQATCCGKSFCKECIERVQAKSKTCPTCKERDSQVFRDKRLQHSLYDFEVYCSHKSKGCEWRGELRELDKHLNSEPPTDKSLEGCPFTVIKCPLNHTGCEVKLSRREIKEHVNNDLLKCVLKQTALVQKLTQDNESLTERLQAADKERQQLKQSMIELQGKLEKVEGAQQPTAYLEQRVTKLEGEVVQLKQAQYVASHTCQPIGPVEFTMANFEQHKNDERWYSPPFYTHPHGYKLCLCVWPNGYGRGNSTHLGVTVHMMREEFDDHLKWPFRGNITLVLVDQDTGIHIQRVLQIDDQVPDRYTKRVVNNELNTYGWGFYDIVTLSDLQPRYLKNDCIKLSIKKVVLTH